MLKFSVSHSTIIQQKVNIFIEKVSHFRQKVSIFLLSLPAEKSTKKSKKSNQKTM